MQIHVYCSAFLPFGFAGNKFSFLYVLPLTERPQRSLSFIHLCNTIMVNYYFVSTRVRYVLFYPFIRFSSFKDACRMNVLYLHSPAAQLA
jgi:hypothetical protein